MPANRLLHHRAGHSHKVSMLTDLEHRVWIQYLLSADDFGVMRATATQLQADNDALGARPAKLIQRALERLIACRLVLAFVHQGKPFVFQPDWQAYQKVEYPRATDNPKPGETSMVLCDEATAALFLKHPGGQRKYQRRADDVPTDLERASQIDPEGIPPRGKRLMANGTRLMAHSSEGSLRETTLPMDLWFCDLKAAYPQQSVSSGYLTQQAFTAAILSQGTPEATFTVMLVNLESQKRGHQWRVKAMIPRLDRWLREGLWEQHHDDHPPLVNEKTAGTLGAAAAILGGKA